MLRSEIFFFTKALVLSLCTLGVCLVIFHFRLEQYQHHVLRSIVEGVEEIEVPCIYLGTKEGFRIVELDGKRYTIFQKDLSESKEQDFSIQFFSVSGDQIIKGSREYGLHVQHRNCRLNLGKYQKCPSCIYTPYF